MKYWIKRKVWQIRNLFRWFPIIWNQYDFDYHYCLEVFKFQLQKTAERLESEDAVTQSAKHRASQIRTAIRLMEKVYDEGYSLEYFDKIEERFGEEATDFYFEDTGHGDGSSYLKRNSDLLPNAKEIEEFREKEREKSLAKQEKAERILWLYIKNNIEGWWD